MLPCLPALGFSPSAAALTNPGVIGGLLAWPVAVLFMGVSAGAVAFYAYILPFLISTVAGSLISGLMLFALSKNGALAEIQNRLR